MLGYHVELRFPIVTDGENPVAVLQSLIVRFTIFLIDVSAFDVVATCPSGTMTHLRLKRPKAAKCSGGSAVFRWSSASDYDAEHEEVARLYRRVFRHAVLWSASPLPCVSDVRRGGTGERRLVQRVQRQAMAENSRGAEGVRCVEQILKKHKGLSNG